MLTNKTFQQLLSLSDGFSLISLGNLNGDDTYLLTSDDCGIEDAKLIVKDNIVIIKSECDCDNNVAIDSMTDGIITGNTTIASVINKYQ
jgi:hypothetical protein